VTNTPTASAAASTRECLDPVRGRLDRWHGGEGARRPRGRRSEIAAASASSIVAADSSAAGTTTLRLNAPKTGVAELVGGLGDDDDRDRPAEGGEHRPGAAVADGEVAAGEDWAWGT
jgi:hypothetical protein